MSATFIVHKNFDGAAPAKQRREHRALDGVHRALQRACERVEAHGHAMPLPRHRERWRDRAHAQLCVCVAARRRRVKRRRHSRRFAAQPTDVADGEALLRALCEGGGGRECGTCGEDQSSHRAAMVFGRRPPPITKQASKQRRHPTLYLYTACGCACRRCGGGGGGGGAADRTRLEEVFRGSV